MYKALRFTLVSLLMMLCGTAFADYVKVTQTSDITDGDYLIVYEAENVAFNGALETLDAAGNTVAVEISDGKIASSEAIDAAVFTFNTTDMSIKSASGLYVGITSYANGLKQTNELNDKFKHTSFAINEDGNVIITKTYEGGDMIMNFNSNKSDKRFRYYKGGSQKAIQLYKKTSGETPQSKTFTATFENDGNWAEVFAYTWTEGETKVEQLGAWPGTKIEATDEGYIVSLEATEAPAKIIFNNGADVQTADLDFEDGATYNSKGKVVPLKDFSVTLTINKEWTNVYAYAWTGETSLVPWPGTEITATKTEEGLYTYAFQTTEAPANIIFNDGTENAVEGVNKTADLVFVNGKKYVCFLSSAEAPLTVSQAVAAIDAGIATTDVVFVEGIVSQVDSYNSTYKSITYWISTDGTTENQFEVYSGKGINGADFASKGDIEVGAKVIVKGNIKKYGEIYEFDKSNLLVKYEAPAPVAKTYTASFTTNKEWAEVYAYSWTGTEGEEGFTKFLGDWPGTKMTKDEETAIFSISFEATGKPSNIIFSNGAGEQTADLAFEDAKKYVYIASSADAPLTVAQAVAAIDAGIDATDEVFVEGVISQIDSYNSTYKSITYWISTDGTTENQFEVYSGKGLNGADFASKDDIEVGAKVIVKGKIKKYKEIYEFDKENQLVKYEAPVNPLERVVADGQFYIKNPAKNLFVTEGSMLAEEGFAFTFTFDETIGAYTITGNDFFAFGDKKWYVEGEATSCKIYYILDGVKKYLDCSDRGGLLVNDGNTEGTPLVDANYTWQLVEKAAPEPVYTLVGAYKVGDVNKYPSNLFWGAEWDVTKEENNMVKGDNGIYTIEFKDVAFTELGTIQYKVVKNHAYANGEWGFSGNNAEYIINETGTYDITFKFNPDATFENGFNVDCVVNKQAAPEQTWTAPTIAGDTPENGKDYKVLNVGSGKYLAMGKAWFSWGTTAILADEGFDATFTGDAASFTLTNKGNGKFVFTSGNDIQGDAMHADGANATSYGLTQMPDGNYHIHDAGGNAESPCWGYNSSFHATGIVAHADANAEGWNCEWIFIATDNMNAVENYLAKKALYDALIYAKENEVNTDEASAVYTNSESTIDELKAAAEKLTHATNLAVNTKTVAGATAENPVETNFVVNGTFDTAGVIAPWKTTGGFQNQTTATNQNGAFTVPFFENWNGSAKVNKMYQVIEDIPNGVYTLKIAAFVNTLADPNESQFVFANNDKTFLTTGEPTAYTVTTVVTNNKIEIGLEQTTATANWMGIDNVSLLYAPVNLTELINAYNTAKEAAQAVEGKMNKDVKAALERALAVDVNMEDADAIGAATAALTEATSAATASVAAFANATNVLPKMKELIDGTNVYTAEALAEYYTQWLEKYEAETLTAEEGNALQDPSIVTGWHASITVDNFLLSAWDTNPDFVDAPYYINSWSIEGDNDGSNFRVPFFEYWTGDTNSLGEKTLTATMDNLEAGEYNVSAWVRVRMKNGAEAPAYGITFQANEGEAVNVTGDQVGETQMYLKEVTATGTVAEDGVLKIKFNVAADNNISWLSFKNVKFEKQEAPATTYTVTVAETQNGTVEVDKTEAAENETVSVTVTPADGYMVDEAYWTYGEGENETKTQIGEPAEGNTATFTMPAANVTVTVTFKAVAAEIEKFYIMGTGTANEWNTTTEMAYNEKTQAFEYTVEGESGAWIAFGDVEFTNWDDFNANHRYAIGEGDVNATVGEAMQLKKVNGTLALPAGKFNVSVTKELLCTITEVVAPATHTWDFTQWSEATVTNLKADAAASKVAGWSDVEKKADAEADAEPTEASKDNCFWAVIPEGGELKANDVAIEELKGLEFGATFAGNRSLAIAVNYPSTSLGEYNGPAYLWLGGKNFECFTIKNVKAGTQIKMGVESHKPADARGVELFVDGTKLTDPEGAAVAAPTTYTEQTWQVPAGEGVVDVVVKNTNGCHIYFIDAEIGEPAETIETMYIVGELTGGWPSDEDWSMAKAMTQDVENKAIWTLTVEGFEAEAKTYYYKATANGKWGVYELPGAGANNDFVFGTDEYPAGKYDLLFTVNTDENTLTLVATKHIEDGITMLKAAIENGTVYNMNGQKVNKAQKGLYIINGRKVVIK